MTEDIPHPFEVEAHYQLLSQVLGRVPGASKMGTVASGLGVVRSWLDGEPVSLEDLDAARRQAHGRAKALFGAQRSRSWLCNAVGNLCWMACGERGWQRSHRSTLDAAVYALTSQLPNDGPPSERVAIRDELVRFVEKARAEASARVSLDIERAGPPSMRRIPDLSSFIGTLANQWLHDSGAEIDPRLLASSDELRSLLEKHGLPAYPSALAFDARYGGIVQPAESQFGVKATIARMGVYRAEGPAGHPLTQVGAQGDVVLYLDAQGQGWTLDLVSDPEPVLSAANGDVLFARTILFDVCYRRRLIGDVADLEGHRGAEIAAELGLPAVGEASDRLGRFWGDARTVIAETHWPGQGDVTIVAGEIAEAYRK